MMAIYGSPFHDGTHITNNDLLSEPNKETSNTTVTVDNGFMSSEAPSNSLLTNT
jgi:hypothetical protein